MSKRPITAEEVRNYFMQFRGNKFEPLNDHLNGSNESKIYYKSNNIVKAKELDKGPDGLPFNKKRRNLIS